SEEAVKAVNGKISSKWDTYGVSIDSRTVKQGDLFIAIKGENFDGHEYVKQALDKGASAAMVHEIPQNVPKDKLLVVNDTMTGLEQLGIASRNRTKARIIAVTGSMGKTSTKEMLRQVISSQAKVHANEGNLNNHWGLPLTLCRMPKDTEYAVLEMGMSSKSELLALTLMGKPDIALITSIGAAHMEFFETIEDIADAKAEIFHGLSGEKTAVLNTDMTCFDRIKNTASKTADKILTFGSSKEADIQLVEYKTKSDGIHVSASVCGNQIDFSMPVTGYHWASNSLGVLAVIKALNLSIPKALETLSSIVPPKGRGNSHIVDFDNGTIQVIDDTYNANPDSMRAAIDALEQTSIKNKGRRIAVIGDMLELGSESIKMHVSIAEYVATKQIDLVFASGTNMKAMFDALPKQKRGDFAENSKELAQKVIKAVKVNDVIMVKGSRGSRMEYVVKALNR
ncbi:MAG: UDP-N-acetylmuramoyl-tripeptide--D-alanyl-D-alanine ligase, partial [Alphaproteobacteria bacterium]|nr:UDP-N-acetylmuramoyl-tripeptide--D-alanyl-D-alanine ligase [Alphaproteobacteria bacterium]